MLPSLKPDNTRLDWLDKLPKNIPPVGDAATRYENLTGERQLYLDSAYRNAQMTLPTLIREDKESNDVARHPWQGTGAEGVSHLASKFNVGLFPTGGLSFFSMLPDKIAMDNLVFQLKENGVDGDAWRNGIEASAASMETKIMNLFNKMSIRSKMHKCFEHLLVAGNVLLYVGKDETLIYPLDKYVLRRTAGGKVLEILIQEQVYPDQMPAGFLEKHYEMKVDDYRNNFNKNITVTTRVHYDYKSELVFWWQEAFNVLIPGSQSSCPLAACPFLPMRFDTNENSPYAEGLISKLFGPLVRLDGMTEQTSIGYAASMRLLYLIDPSSTVTPLMLRDANSMDAFMGSADSISVLQGGKHYDLAAATNYESKLMNEIQLRMAMPIAIQRKGERVTAAEIEILAAQLESTSAGFYSLFSDEVQVPLVQRLLHIGESMGLPSLEKIREFRDENNEPIVTIKPITGLAALGRNSDLQKLMQMIQIMGQLPQETLSKYVNMTELLQRLTTALGVNTGGLIYSPEEIAQQEQAAMEAQQQQEQQVVDQSQEQNELKLADTALNSSVLTELIKTGQISAEQLNSMMGGTEGVSNTAAATRSGNF